MHRSRAQLSLAAMALSTAMGCGYSPNPPSGTLMCSSQSTCPENYRCVSSFCWTGVESNLLGTWTFGATSKQVTSCSDGSKTTTNLQGTDGYAEVTPGGAAVLASDYYCLWQLDVMASGTVIEAGQSCTKPDDNTPTTSYTWHGQSFSLTTDNGRTGSLAASLPYDYQSLTGSGHCSLQITADLTKTKT